MMETAVTNTLFGGFSDSRIASYREQISEAISEKIRSRTTRQYPNAPPFNVFSLTDEDKITHEILSRRRAEKIDNERVFISFLENALTEGAAASLPSQQRADIEKFKAEISVLSEQFTPPEKSLLYKKKGMVVITSPNKSYFIVPNLSSLTKKPELLLLYTEIWTAPDTENTRKMWDTLRNIESALFRGQDSLGIFPESEF